ncbi:MAG: glycosyltransferase family 39 protein, partial [Frankiaceae bacterium]|nr:glycosyltransferase family 39 protein [Frankiaceae bacterium]
WLSPILLLQAVLCFRLTNGLEEDEALSINAGHQMIGHLLHGTATPAFGRYFGGIPSVFAVPAAMLDHIGGPDLVRATNTVLVLLATVLVYLTARRMVGQGAALLAAAVFAINPTTIFVARFASADAPCLLFLAASLYFAVVAVERRAYPWLAGALLSTAVAEKYVVILFVPGVLITAAAFNLRTLGAQQTRRLMLRITIATLLGLAVWAAVGHGDWSGFGRNALGGHTIDEIAGLTLWRDGWDYVGVLALASVVTAAVLRGRRWLTVVLCAAGLIPVLVEIVYQESASLQRNIALSMVFLAPVLGLLGAALLSPGRFLGARAPLAVVGSAVLLSSGMGTSAAMIHGWPTSTSINSALRYYAHDGSQRFLVDGSDLPAYYLSDVTSYGQWSSTLDDRYASPGGVTRLRTDIESGAYRLVLYRDNGATPALDRSMIPTLRTRYTLVAKVPVTNDNNHAYWSLWLSELPR